MAYDAGRVEVGVGAKLDRASWKKVDAEVKKASAQKAEVAVGFKVDRRQLDRAYQLLRKWRTERADAKLGFTVLRGQYNEHLRMVRTAGRREAKASLGFKIDRANLRQFEAQVAHAIRRVSRDLTVDVKVRLDESAARSTTALRENEAQVDRTRQRLEQLGTAGGVASRAFAGMVGSVGKMSVSLGPLSGRLQYLSNAAVILAPIMASLAGVMVALGSSFVSAAAGAAAAGGAIGSALVPAGILGIGVMTRLTEAMDVFALREKAVEATATDVTKATNDQVRSADQLADSFDGVQGALESLQDSYDAVTDAQQQVVRATRDYRQAVRQARSDVRAAADAEQDAARDVVDAQKEVTAARQEALAVAREANAEARRSALDARDAELSLAEARDEQGAAYRRVLDLQQLPLEEGETQAQRTEAVSDAQRDYQQAQQGVRRAELDLQDARKRQNDTLKEQAKFIGEGAKAYGPLRDAIERVKEAEEEHAKTVKELNRLRRRDIDDVPAVVAALEGIRDANEGLERSLRNVERAHRAVAAARRQRATVAEAQEEVPEIPLSQIRRAQYGFEQLTEAEQDFVVALEHLRESFRRDLQPATDAFFRVFTHGLERGGELVDDLKGPLNDLGGVLAGELRDTIDMLTGREWTEFFEQSTEFAKDLAPPLADILRDFADIFRLFAEAAQGETLRLFEDLAEVTGSWLAQLEEDPKGLRRAMHDMFENFRSWIRLAEALADLLITIVGISDDEGKNTIDGLTDAIEKFDKRLENSADEREDFVDWIKDSKEFLEDLFLIIEPTVKGMADFARFVQGAVDALGDLFGLEDASQGFFRAVGFGFSAIMIGRITGLSKVIPGLLRRLFAGRAATSAVQVGAGEAGAAASNSFTNRLRNRLGSLWGRVRDRIKSLFTRSATSAATNAGADAAGSMVNSTVTGVDKREDRMKRRLAPTFASIGKAMGAVFAVAFATVMVDIIGDALDGWLDKVRDKLEGAGLPGEIFDVLKGVNPITGPLTVGRDLREKLGLPRNFRDLFDGGDDSGGGGSGRSGPRDPKKGRGGATGGLVTPSGIVRGYQRGGLVPRGEDTLVGVQFGEFIMRRDAVNREGVGAMEAINRGDRADTQTGLAETLKKEAQEAGTPLKTIGEMLGALAVEGKVAGAEAGDGIATGLKEGGEEAVETTEDTTRDVTKSWEDLADDTGDAVSDMNKQVGRRFDDIKDTATDSSRDLKRVVTKQFEDTADDVDKATKSIATKTETRMQDAFQSGRKWSRQLSGVVGDSMESLDSAVFTGMKYVGEATNAALDAFNEKKVTLHVPRPKELKRQEGGMIGMKGSRTHDNRSAYVAEGEAVLTGWHQGPLEELMAVGQAAGIFPWGSMDEMFHREQREHRTAPMFQRGGRRGFQRGGSPTSGYVGDIGGGHKPGWRPFMEYMDSLFGPVYVMSGKRNSYVQGSGAVSNHTYGLATDISTYEDDMYLTPDGGPTPARPKARFDKMFAFQNQHFGSVMLDHLWQTSSGGNHYNHIHQGLSEGVVGTVRAMRQFISKLPKGGSYGEMPKIKVEGPDGGLKTIAQSAIGAARSAADDFIDRKSAMQFGGQIPGGAIPVSGGATARTVFDFMVQAGFTESQAAGWCGVIDKESHFSTTIGNMEGSGATGLCQWMDARLTRLQAKPNWTSLQVQLNYIMEELRTTESAAYAAIRVTRGPAQAARVIDAMYERSDNLLDAEARAESYYRQFAGATAQRGGKMGEEGFARGGKLSVAHVGDSIAYGMRRYGGLAGKLKKIGIHGQTKGGISSPTALGYLRSTLRDSDDAIIFDAGTNDATKTTVRSSIQKVKEMADGRPVIVPATRGGAAASKNAMLEKLGGIEFMPWNVDMGDSVHPSVPTGYGQRASKLAKLVRQLVASGTDDTDETGSKGPTGKKSPGGKKLLRFWDLDYDAQEFFGIRDAPEGFQRGGLKGVNLSKTFRSGWKPPSDSALRKGAAPPPKRGGFVAGKLLPGRAEKLLANVSSQVEGEEEVGGGTWQEVLSNLERRTKQPRQNFEQAKVDISGLESRISTESALADRTEEDFVLAPGDPGFDAQTSRAIHAQLGTPGADSGTLPYVDQEAVDRRTAELTKIGKLYYKQAQFYRTLEMAIVRLVKLTRGARTRLRQLRGKATKKASVDRFNKLIGDFTTELGQLTGTTYEVRAGRAGQFLDYQGIQRELAELAPGAQAELGELLAEPAATPDTPEDDLTAARLASVEALNEALRGRDVSQQAFIRSISGPGDIAQGGFQNAFGAVATPYAGAALAQQQGGGVPRFGDGVTGMTGAASVVINQTNQMLTPSDPAVLRGVASATVAGIGLQSFRPATRESWGV